MAVALTPISFLLVLFFMGLARAGVQKSAEDGNELAFDAGIVELVNSLPTAGWVAGDSPRLHGLTKREVRRLLGTFPRETHPSRSTGLIRMKTQEATGTASGSGGSLTLSLPKEFDARKRWSHCPTISQIRDQSRCGSCWVFGAVESLSNRFCVHLNESVALSTEDVLTCCGDFCGDGCDGGWDFEAWEYFVKEGVVTAECQPYYNFKNSTVTSYTPPCSRTCVNGDDWSASKHYAADVYMLRHFPEDIMLELMEHGPIEVDFTVYSDFMHYISGVYHKVAGAVEGGHAVKLVGWGTTEEGLDYWTIANSWGPSWGENGFFRMRRGTNECGIEEGAIAGIPSLRRSKGKGPTQTA